MIATVRDVEGALRPVLRTLVDGQHGNRTLGQRLRSKLHRRFFLAESLRRAKFRGVLEEALRLEGVRNPQAGGSSLGWLHGSSLTVCSGLKVSDRTLLKIAGHGEEKAVTTYQQALDSRLPSHLRRLLLDQAPSMHRACEYVKAAAWL